MRKVYLDDIEGNEMYKLSFYSPSSGFVAFRDWIGFTSDSGHSFTKKNITLNNVNYNGYSVNLTFGFKIHGVKAFSQSKLLVYGDYGYAPSILYSDDGGNSFSLRFHSQIGAIELTDCITDMAFPNDGNIGYATDADRILKTTDQGLTWIIVYNYQNLHFKQLQTLDTNTVYAIGENILLKTANSGESWRQIFAPAPYDRKFNSFYFLNPNIGWLNIDDNGYLYKTINGGETWALQNNIETTPFATSKMLFMSNDIGFAISGFYQVYKTNNSGMLWERLPRDNDYIHLLNGHNDIQFLNNTQFWAGGGHGFLELNTNMLTSTIPNAAFNIDTTGVEATGIVQLQNYSSQSYSYKWYVNNVLISTSYNTTYTHDIYSGLDSIKLVVNSGIYSDSTTKNQYFIPVPPLPIPTISDFTPKIGYTDAIITIKGTNFNSATSITFGGIPAKAFATISDTIIAATVGNGATGDIQLVNSVGKTTATGFSYVERMKINSFEPTSGPVGTVVTISGTRFGNSIPENVVYLGGVKATVISASNSQLQIKVPYGVSQQPLTVTSNGLTVSANHSFAITNATVCEINRESFSDTMQFITDINPERFLTADLDGDGKLDMVSSSTYRYDRLLIFRNVSSKNHIDFVEATILNRSSPSGPTGEFLIKDMDADGKLDIIVIDRGFCIFKNISVPGKISFAEELYFISNDDNNIYQELQTDDLDGDGKPEVIGLNGSNFEIIIAKNTSSGGNISFADYNTRMRIDNNGGMFNLRVADIDNDGKKDILMQSNLYSDVRLNILRNTTTNSGSISFAPLTFITFFGVSLELSDLDMDGKVDISSLEHFPNLVRINRNLSTPGTVAFSDPQFIPITFYADKLTSGDLNGDGKPEIIVSSIQNTGLDIPFQVYKNKSTTGTILIDTAITFGLKTSSIINHRYSNISDFDLDGRNDIATFYTYVDSITYDGTPTVSVYRNMMCGENELNICAGGEEILHSNINGTVYKWQQNNGQGFANISENSHFSGTNMRSLQLKNVPSSWYGYEFRCEVDGVNSDVYPIHISNYWTGGASNSWNNPTNWSCGVVPDSNTDVVISKGSVMINANSVCRSATVMPGASLKIATGYTLTINN